jgi:ATP-dependent DNA helicase PIF1
MPTFNFGDFAWLPPVGDTPLYSDKSSSARTTLSQEGCMVFEHFTQSVTLDTVYRQAGNDHDQVAFRDALLHLRTYSTTQEDYDLLATRFWDVLTPAERLTFEDVIHLLPTRAAVLEFNCRHLSSTGQPVIRYKAKHNHSEAKKASDDDADGLEKEVLLAEGAKVMLTCNLWTSKGNVAYTILINNILKSFSLGLVNGAQGIVKKIWFHQGSNPCSHLPAVVFVKFDGYTGKMIGMILINIVLCSSYLGPDNPGWEGIDPSWVPIVPSIAHWENKSGKLLSRTQLPLNMAWGITIHKSQGLTLEHAVIELGRSDFSAGLSFVAISRVKSLKGLAFRSQFDLTCLQKPESETMKMLRKDNDRHCTLGFCLNTYGMDLSDYSFNP